MSQTDKCHTPPVRRVPLCHLMDGATYTVDGGGEPEKKKLRSPVNSAVSKNKSRRSSKRRITFQPLSESDTLRAELRSTHQTYAKSLCEKDQEIAELKKHLLVTSTLFAEDIDTIQKENDSLRDDLNITEGELTIFQKSEKEWIGRSLKLKFILDQIKKIQALPKDHAEWVDPMVDDIDMPEVPINVRDEFVPTTQTDNIDWVDSEDEEDEEYAQEALEAQEAQEGRWLLPETQEATETQEAPETQDAQETQEAQEELAYLPSAAWANRTAAGLANLLHLLDQEYPTPSRPWARQRAHERDVAYIREEDEEETHTFDSCSNCGDMNDHYTCDCPNPSGFAWRNAPWPPEHETITDIWPQIEIEEHAATLIQAHYRGKMVRQMPYRKQRKEQLDKELDEYMNSN